MSISEIYKLIILIVFIGILLSLASSAFFLTKEQGKANRMVQSLTVRVILSVTLFCMLIFGYFTGLLKPHGLMLPAKKSLQEHVQDYNSQ